MATAAPTKYTSRLKAEYNAKWAKELKDELKLANIQEVPRLEKIVINAGLGRAKDEKRILEVASNTIRKITGQQPVETIAARRQQGRSESNPPRPAYV
jgi:large subunit ribosomal protein L5